MNHGNALIWLSLFWFVVLCGVALWAIFPL